MGWRAWTGTGTLALQVPELPRKRVSRASIVRWIVKSDTRTEVKSSGSSIFPQQGGDGEWSEAVFSGSAEREWMVSNVY